MHVFNIHRREIRASAQAVGSAIDSLASRNDRPGLAADEGRSS